MYTDYPNRNVVEKNIASLFQDAIITANLAHIDNVSKYSNTVEHRDVIPGAIVSEQKLIDPKTFMRRHYRHHACASQMFEAIYGACLDEQNHLTGLGGGG